MSVERDDLRADVSDDADFNEPESSIISRVQLAIGTCRSCDRDNVVIDYRGPTPTCLLHKGSPD